MDLTLLTSRPGKWQMQQTFLPSPSWSSVPGTLAGDRGRKLDKYVGVAEGSWSLLLLVVRVIPDPLTFVSAPGSGQCQTLPNSDPKLASDSGLMFDNWQHTHELRAILVLKNDPIFVLFYILHRIIHYILSNINVHFSIINGKVKFSSEIRKIKLPQPSSNMCQSTTICWIKTLF